MEYKGAKQKPVFKGKPQPVSTQEFGTAKVQKFGTVSNKPQQKKHFKLPKLKLGKIKVKLPKTVDVKTKRIVEITKHAYKFSSRRQKIVAVVVIFIIVGFGGFLIIRGTSNNNKQPKIAGKSSIRLSFTPIVAPGKTIYVDPEGKRDTGSYPDVINGINIRVSEQVLPKDFKPDVQAKMDNFAKYNYYSEQITAGDTKVYIGMSVKGVESVMFTKNDLLVFIKAESKVDNNQLADYIKSLK